MSISLRAARALDAGQAGDILHQCNRDTDWMPDLHSAAETIGFCGTMIDRGWVTVAERQGRVIGFLARDGADICGLYLRSGERGQGVGKHLLDRAKAQSEVLQLRAFQANDGARRFYAREGFVEITRGDGAGNDENLPDVHMIWRREAAQ